MLLLFVVTSSILLRYPGIHYDEVLFTNGALRVDNTTFITASFWKIPLLLMPYIGGLKTYFFVPIFAIFGPNVIAMRALNIAFMVAFLWLTYILVSRYLNRKIGLLTLALLATNASIITFGRTDFGPIALEHVLFVLAIFVFQLFITQKKWHYLWLTCVVLALGIFNKLNFIWFINSFYFAFTVIYLRDWRKIFSKRQLIKLLMFAGCFYAASVAYYLFISRYYKLQGDLSFGNPQHIFNSALETLGGQWFFRGPFGSSDTHTLSYTLMGLGAALIAVYLGLLYKNKRWPSKLFLLSASMAFTQLVQISLTPAATAGWHYLSLQPFWAIMLASAFYEIAQSVRLNLHKRLVYLSAAVLCAVQIGMYYTNLSLLKNNKSVYWSEAIYDLGDYARRQDSMFVSADWGIHTQLITLDPVRQKYLEAFGPINPEDPAQVTLTRQKFFEHDPARPVYLITHEQDIAVYPELQAALLTIADSGSDVEVAHEIFDGPVLVFRIYKVTPSP